MDYNKYDFLQNSEVSNFRLVLDYLVLIPIAIMCFFVLVTSSTHDMRFSLLRLIKHHPIAVILHLPSPVVSVGVIPGQQLGLQQPQSEPSSASTSAISTATVPAVTNPVSTPSPVASVAPQYKIKTVVIKPRDNFNKVFKRLSLDTKTATTILAANKSIRELRNLKPGQDMDFFFDGQNVLQKITYQPDFKSIITFSKDNNYHGNIAQLTAIAKLEYAFAPIQGSVFVAARKAGISQKLVAQVANIFSSRINLKKGLRSGDKLALLCKNYYIADKRVGNSEVVAAEIVHKGQALSAVSFTDPKGNTDFYSPDGYSLKSPFIRFPVKYKEISSPFSLGRYHPILGIVRPHTGVDLAANYGTPVKATSDGTISFIGYKDGLGKTVEIKHNQFSTIYGHMEGFAKGVKRGQTIHQGELIGYIGSTGLSTGPHLHYEFHINGKAYDPLKVKLPEKEMIASKYRSQFLAQAKKAMAVFGENIIKD